MDVQQILFDEELIALQAIKYQFEDTYPGLEYQLIFERNLCDEKNL